MSNISKKGNLNIILIILSYFVNDRTTLFMSLNFFCSSVFGLSWEEQIPFEQLIKTCFKWHNAKETGHILWTWDLANKLLSEEHRCV